MIEDENTPGLGDAIRNFFPNRLQAAHLLFAKLCARDENPFVEIDGVTIVGQLKKVNLKSGIAVVEIPGKNPLDRQFPARTVHLFEYVDITSE